MSAPPTFQMRSALTGTTYGTSSWLQGYNAVRFRYAMGLAMDLLLEKQNQGMRAKLPGLTLDPVGSAPLMAADRLIVQGPAEPFAQFQQRIQNAFNAWSTAGSRASVMGQVQAYLTGLEPGVTQTLPEMVIVGNDHVFNHTHIVAWDTLYFYNPLGYPPAHVDVSAPINWNWDNQNFWWRNWLVLFMALVSVGKSGTTATVASTGGSGVSGVTTGFATLTGLSGLTSANVGEYLIVTGAATSANNGTFQITSVSSASSCIIANTSAVSPDANNGSIHWSISKYPYIGPAPVWGSPNAVWGSTNTWGVNCSTLVIASIRNIVQRWKSAETWYVNIIISFGGGDSTAGNEFSPLSSQGAGNPDGTWGPNGTKISNGVLVNSYATVNPFTSFCDGTGQYVQCSVPNVT